MLYKLWHWKFFVNVAAIPNYKTGLEIEDIRCTMYIFNYFPILLPHVLNYFVGKLLTIKLTLCVSLHKSELNFPGILEPAFDILPLLFVFQFSYVLFQSFDNVDARVSTCFFGETDL